MEWIPDNLLVLTASWLNSVLGSDLVDVLNYGFQHDQLSVSQRRGLLSLIFKKEEKGDLRNWRPMSLPCVDYKIGTKALAAQLQKVLSSVLREDQTCGVPARSIFRTGISSEI